MRNKLFCRLILTVLCIGMVGPMSAEAQSTNSSPANLPPPILDNDEMMKLKAAREQVLAAHPDLKAEEQKLKAMHDSMQTQTPPPTAEQRNAAFAEWRKYQKTMRAETLKIDPTLSPIFAKLDAARKKNGAASPFQPAAK
jgi:hypothetical protein